MEYFAKQYANAIYKETGDTICITDMDEVIAAEGDNSKDMIGKPISGELENMALRRKSVIANKKDRAFIKIVDGEVEYKNEIVCPIISGGDVVGTVSLLCNNEKKIGELEEKLINCAASFLSKQFE